MNIHTVMTAFSTVALMTLQGCATISATGSHTNPAAATHIPAADPMLDHFIAWVPRDKAQTATVAEAMTHISLVNARQQTAKQLCNGSWVMNGEASDNVGPFPTAAPETAGGYPAWYYRISHRPGLHGCRSMNSQILYHALQENLPEWMDIEAARTTTLSLLE